MFLITFHRNSVCHKPLRSRATFTPLTRLVCWDCAVRVLFTSSIGPSSSHVLPLGASGTCGRSKHLRFFVVVFLDPARCRRCLLSWCRVDEAKQNLDLAPLKASSPSGQQTARVSAFCCGAPKIPPRLCVPAWGIFFLLTQSCCLHTAFVSSRGIIDTPSATNVQHCTT